VVFLNGLSCVIVFTKIHFTSSHEFLEKRNISNPLKHTSGLNNYVFSAILRQMRVLIGKLYSSRSTLMYDNENIVLFRKAVLFTSSDMSPHWQFPSWHNTLDQDASRRLQRWSRDTIVYTNLNNKQVGWGEVLIMEYHSLSATIDNETMFVLCFEFFVYITWQLKEKLCYLQMFTGHEAEFPSWVLRSKVWLIQREFWEVI